MSDEVYGMGFAAGQSFRLNLVAECEEALRTTHSALVAAEADRDRWKADADRLAKALGGYQKALEHTLAGFVPIIDAEWNVALAAHAALVGAG